MGTAEGGWEKNGVCWISGEEVKMRTEHWDDGWVERDEFVDVICTWEGIESKH